MSKVVLKTAGWGKANGMTCSKSVLSWQRFVFRLLHAAVTLRNYVMEPQPGCWDPQGDAHGCARRRWRGDQEQQTGVVKRNQSERVAKY